MAAAHTPDTPERRRSPAAPHGSERGQLRAPRERQARLGYCGLISTKQRQPGAGVRWHLPSWAAGLWSPEAVEPPAWPALQRGDSHHPPTAPAPQVNSQDLQVAQGSEGSIFDAADLVVVQLPAEREGRG